MPIGNIPAVTPQPVAVQEIPSVTVSQAPAVAPQPVTVQPSPAFGQASTTPASVGVSAQEMPPHVFAGFKLAKIVLTITAGSILLFFFYLFAMDWLIGSDIRDAYQKVLVSNRVGAELLTLTEIQKFSADLDYSRKTPTAQWSAESMQNAQDVLKLVNQLPGVTTDQKAELKDCVPPPTDNTRANKIDACLVTVEGINQAALSAAAATADAKVASDATFRLGEQRQSLHSFWVQAAQLVLLNLLLPLLTALFGYIFGTQQGQNPKGP